MVNKKISLILVVLAINTAAYGMEPIHNKSSCMLPKEGTQSSEVIDSNLCTLMASNRNTRPVVVLSLVQNNDGSRLSQEHRDSIARSDVDEIRNFIVKEEPQYIIDALYLASSASKLEAVVTLSVGVNSLIDCGKIKTERAPDIFHTALVYAARNKNAGAHTYLAVRRLAAVNRGGLLYHASHVSDAELERHINYRHSLDYVLVGSKIDDKIDIASIEQN